jgi:DNA-directed RNA polymerase I, II, and III subunit RPABC2
MSNPRDGDDIEYNDNEENELALSGEEEDIEEEEEEEKEERLIKKAKAKAKAQEDDEAEEDDEDDSQAMDWQDDDAEEDDEDEMMYGDTAEGDEEDEEAQDLASRASSSSNRDEEDDEGEGVEEDDHPHGERYLQKLDERLKKDYLQEIHPEAFLHNYEEVMSLSQITRDENYRIIDPLHKTLPFLTKYERTRLLGMRAKQINAGATPLVEVPETMLDGQLIAERELQERKLPFVLRRPLPNGTFEYWRVSDLELL